MVAARFTRARRPALRQVPRLPKPLAAGSATVYPRRSPRVPFVIEIMKDMGTVMKNAMAQFAAAGLRVDGKQVSEMVKRELSK